MSGRAEVCDERAANEPRGARDRDLHPLRLRRSAASSENAPAPMADRYKKMKQRSEGVSPWFTMGNNPRGAWNMKYATAISPEQRSAKTCVNKPRIMHAANT